MNWNERAKSLKVRQYEARRLIPEIATQIERRSSQATIRAQLAEQIKERLRERGALKE